MTKITTASYEIPGPSGDNTARPKPPSERCKEGDHTWIPLLRYYSFLSMWVCHHCPAIQIHDHRIDVIYRITPDDYTSSDVPSDKPI